MATDADNGPQPSCSAFIKHSTRRLRRRATGSNTKQPEVPGPDSDDYGFLGSRRAGGGQWSSNSETHPCAPPQRRREVLHAGAQSRRGGRGGDDNGGRRASMDGGCSVASSGCSIPITLGSLAASSDAGASSQRCSIDEIERRSPSAGSARPDSPWSEMSIHLAGERPQPEAFARPPPPPQQHHQSRYLALTTSGLAAAAETIGKYHCHGVSRSRSAGPPSTRSRSDGTDGRAPDMNFYARMRHTREAASVVTPAGGNRSKSECRGAGRSTVFQTSSVVTVGSSAVASERPSRSVSRRRRGQGNHEQAIAETKRQRSSSKSRDIVALYTRSATPAAATPLARSQSCPRRSDSVASSSASTIVGGSVGAAGWQQQQQQQQQRQQRQQQQQPCPARTLRSKSAAPPRLRVSDAGNVVPMTAAPAIASYSGPRRSHSQPRLQSGRAHSMLSGGGGDCGSSRTESVLSSLGADSLSDSLRVWAATAARSPTSRSTQSTTPRSRRNSGQPARGSGSGGDGWGGTTTGHQSIMAVLEMDKDANARIEEALNNANSLRPADVPLMAIAGYKPADDSWASGDEVCVEAGALVLAKYKQCEWVYVCTPHGSEGFMPYAYTKPIKVDAPAGDSARGHAQRAVRPAAAAAEVASAAPSSIIAPRPMQRSSVVAASSALTAATTNAAIAPIQTRPTPRPRPSSSRCEPLSAAWFAPSASDRRESRRCPSSASSTADSSPGWPSAVAHSWSAFRRDAGDNSASHVERIWRRVWDESLRLPASSSGGGFAAAPLRPAAARSDGMRATDASSVASSDCDSVFYEATLAVFDADALSVSGSEEVQRAWSSQAAEEAAAMYSASSRESTPVMATAVGHSTDYYSNNAAFFSDSGISEPCSDLGASDGDRPRRFRSATAAPLSAKATAKSTDACGAAMVRSGHLSATEQHPSGERCAERGGGRRRRAGGDRRRLRPSSDALDRARTAAPVALRSSLCPELTRDYGGPAATVVYDYDAENNDDVGARAGESVCVLNEDDPQWLWVQKRDGSEGFLPRDNVLFLPYRPAVRADSRGLMTTVLAAV